jgi:protein-tyrosine phosphatase
MIRVLFVCLGNYCRSPMAEAIFRHKVNKAGVADQFQIDSAGTGKWFVGKSPHRKTQQVLRKNNINFEGILGRQIKREDLQLFDYIIVMDSKNLSQLHQMADKTETSKIARLLDFVPNATAEDVADPYITGKFEEVYQLINEACDHLLSYIRK